MKYEVIMENGDYALIQRGDLMQEYAVVYMLDKEKGEWAWTCTYSYFGKYSSCTQAKALANCIDYFRHRTEENYISRPRLEELATKFKDGLIEDDRETAMEYFEDYCEMEEHEYVFFGIERESEE